MKITTDAKTFADAVKRADIIHGGRKVRHDLVIAADDTGAHVTAHDYDAQVRVPLPGAQVDETGHILVDARQLTAIPAGGDLTVNSSGNPNAPYATFTNGDRWSTSLRAPDVHDDHVERYFTAGGNDLAIVAAMPARRLVDALERVLTSASRVEARPILCGVLVEETDNGLRLVATDSYRLTVETIPRVRDGELGDPVTLPGTVRKLPRIIGKAGDVNIHRAEDGHVIVTGDRATMVFRPVDGTFPQWRQLIVGGEARTATVDKTALLGALKPFVAAAQATKKEEKRAAPGIHVRIDATKPTIAFDIDTMHAETPIDHDWHPSTAELDIMFNAALLANAVGIVQGDTVHLRFQDSPLKPATIVGPDGLLHDTGTLLMPMKYPGAK